MPNCDFYAWKTDVALVLDFIFSQPGWRLWELASRNDCDLRHFSKTEEVLQTFALESQNLHFHLHAPEMGGRVHEERITFKPEAVPGATFRIDSRGWGLIQLYFVTARDGKIRPSHTNHNTQNRAQRWAPTYSGHSDRVESWNWQNVERISAKLNRFIRQAACSKRGSRPLLPDAHAAANQGVIELIG